MALSSSLQARCPADGLLLAAPPPDVDASRMKQAVRDVMETFQEDPMKQRTEAPARIAGRYPDLFPRTAENGGPLAGGVAPAAGGRGAPSDEVVVLPPIPFVTLCDQHLLPFLGSVRVAYLPGLSGKGITLSQVTRSVEELVRRPLSQRNLTTKVAQAVCDRLGATGVAVTVEAEHVCLNVRGADPAACTVHTSAVRGRFEREASLGAAMVSLLQ